MPHCAKNQVGNIFLMGALVAGAVGIIALMASTKVSSLVFRSTGSANLRWELMDNQRTITNLTDCPATLAAAGILTESDVTSKCASSYGNSKGPYFTFQRRDPSGAVQPLLDALGSTGVTTFGGTYSFRVSCARDNYGRYLYVERAALVSTASFRSDPLTRRELNWEPLYKRGQSLLCANTAPLGNGSLPPPVPPVGGGLSSEPGEVHLGSALLFRHGPTLKKKTPLPAQWSYLTFTGYLGSSISLSGNYGDAYNLPLGSIPIFTPVEGTFTNGPHGCVETSYFTFQSPNGTSACPKLGSGNPSANTVSRVYLQGAGLRWFSGAYTLTRLLVRIYGPKPQP